MKYTFFSLGCTNC